ncbi:MAG: relaxase domain-containing protein, partial [Cyanothece sp. SIO1E1]|nr:relaxase domain-containing protein [Cyanothece sp. SIO1E1]
AGVDLTFSAPKSVSLVALVNGDTQLEVAHRNAVKRTLAVVQERYAMTRVRQGNQRSAVKTGNLVVGQFHHDTSREKDPQLHTHCVVLNVTQLPNRKWQSVHNDAFYRNKMLLGQIYRNELALEVQRLGYEIERGEKGLFEIKGYHPAHLKLFSKRAEQVKAYAGENASPEEKAIAVLMTRAPKGKEISRTELRDYWQAQAQTLGVQHPIPQMQAQLSPAATPVRAVQDAIAHCAERDTAFRHEELEKFILAEVGQYSFAAVQTEIRRRRKHQALIRIDEERYTTQAAINRELRTIELMEQGKGQVRAIAPLKQVNQFLADKSLTTGQRAAVTLASTSTDQAIAWQGVAGAGKSYALNAFRQLAQAQGYEVKGFAPSAEAAKVISDEAQLESATVASLLYSQAQSVEPSEQNPQVWVVDEAGLLSAQDALALLEKAKAQKARLILVGDTRQLSAVAAGNPFKSLQQAGMSTAYLNQSLRQQTQDLQEAVDLVAAGKMTEGIQRLDQAGRIQIIQDPTNRVTQVSRDYLALSPQDRDKTLILAGTHAERLAITQRIRSELKQEGALGDTTLVQQLRAKDLTQVQTKYAHHYEMGDVIMPLAAYKRLGLKKRQLYTVMVREKDALVLVAADGQQLRVNPARINKKVAYQRQEMEIAVGDRLKWTRNQHDLGRRNGQEFRVTAIEGTTAQVQYKNGNTDQIDLTQAQNLDYALVSTTYSSQGKTASRVLISASADRTVGRESFYVAISRAKHDLKIYAEDKQKLVGQAQESRAKENPLELLGVQVRRELRQISEQFEQEIQAELASESSQGQSARVKAEFEEAEIHSHVPLAVELKKRQYQQLYQRYQRELQNSGMNPIQGDVAIATQALVDFRYREATGHIIAQSPQAQRIKVKIGREKAITYVKDVVERARALLIQRQGKQQYHQEL